MVAKVPASVEFLRTVQAVEPAGTMKRHCLVQANREFRRSTPTPRGASSVANNNDEDTNHNDRALTVESVVEWRQKN
jgi:hypothetical protein